jgi:hypothetical protein
LTLKASLFTLLNSTSASLTRNSKLVSRKLDRTNLCVRCPEIKVNPKALTHLTGRRMIPSLDHRKVYWWGEKSNLSIMDLDTLKISDYPIASSHPASKLITYDVLVINQKVVFVMEEAGVYGMVYLYNLLNQTLIANWTYTNDDCNLN